MESSYKVQEPDEARPAKRVRLDGALDITEDLQQEMANDDEDWDDIYGLGVDDVALVHDTDGANGVDRDIDANPTMTTTSYPAVGDLAQTVDDQPPNTTLPPPEPDQELPDGLPAEAFDDGDELVLEEEHDLVGDQIAADITQEPSELEVQSPHRNEDRNESHEENEKQVQVLEPSPQDDVAPATETAVESAATSNAHAAGAATNGYTAQHLTDNQKLDSSIATKTEQPEQDAEFRFDSSDAQSSDSDDSSDSSSDDSEGESEDGYEMLDPATAAKILMSGDGDDDDGDKSKGKSGDHQPRTANEKKEDVVSKPAVVVTEDMKITYLGTVDRSIGNQMLVKAVTPGEYQVLAYGSVLCTKDREVIGAVADTMGRVQEPMYSVSFTNAQELEDSGLVFGTDLFYVDSHSSFVFTQALKSMKGTDASNVHDEEVGEDELEFSDDEAEAEYKRMQKAAKKEGREKLTRGAYVENKAAQSFIFGAPGYDRGRTHITNSDAPQQQYSSGLDYDDVGAPDEFYSPLKRPDNLSQLMASGGPPRPPMDRGRGRGRGDRGRGRGDRGRGRGGFEHRGQRGGRGGHDQDRGRQRQRNERRGNAHSFPDRHNDYANGEHAQQSAPQQQAAPQMPPQQQSGTYQQYPSQQAYSPQSYQFNGYAFQYGNSPPQPPVQQANQAYNQQQFPTANSPGGLFPAGSFVNPTFFQAQQQPQWPPMQQQPQQPIYNAWQKQQQVPHEGTSAPHLAVPQSTPNLAEILKQLGGQQQK